MKNSLLFISGLMTFLFSTIVMAHPGHDHGHWLSQFIHSVMLAVIAIVLAVAIDWLIIRLSTNDSTKGSNKHVT